MTFEQQERKFKKSAIAKAMDDGYLDNPQQAKRYEICFDGKFHLNGDSFFWFSTGIKFDDFE